MILLKRVDEQFTTYAAIRITFDSPDRFVCEYQVDDTLYKFYAYNTVGDWVSYFDAIIDFNEKKPKPAKKITNPSIVLSNLAKCFELFHNRKSGEINTFNIFCRNASVAELFSKIIGNIAHAMPVLDYIGTERQGQLQYFSFKKKEAVSEVS